MSAATAIFDFAKANAIDNVPTIASVENADDLALDEAGRFLANAPEYPPLSEAMEKKLVRHIDRWMIPLLLITVTLGSTEKVVVGTAALYGWRQDTGMHGQQYSWVGSIIFIGMLVGLWPASYLTTIAPIGKYIAGTSILWSILAMLFAACHSWPMIMVLRFFLGFVESALIPSMVLLIQKFYTKDEQPLRNAISISVFSSVVNGFCSWMIGQIPASAPLRRWQYLYLLIGSVNLLWSLCLLFVLPSTPMDAKWLSEEEKYYSISRLASNRTGIQQRVWKWYQVKEALLDYRLHLTFLFNVAINIPNGGLTTFGSIIIENFGYSPQISALLTMPTGVMSTICACAFGWLACRWRSRRALVITLSVLPPILGTVLVYALPRSNKAGQTAGLYLMYGYWGPYMTMLSFPQANTAGQTKKSVMICGLHLGYAVGNFVGPQTFRARQAPAYTGGVIGMLVSFCACMVLINMYWVVCASSNREKDQKYGKLNKFEKESAGLLQDLTDHEQKDFRYTT